MREWKRAELEETRYNENDRSIVEVGGEIESELWRNETDVFRGEREREREDWRGGGVGAVKSEKE